MAPDTQVMPGTVLIICNACLLYTSGNPCTILRYVSSESKAVDGGTETIIRLRDDQYSVDVTLYYIAYPKEDVIKTWSEISHQEKKPVMLRCV